MAITIKKGSTSMGMKDFASVLQKDHGEKILSFGGALQNSDRIPTGLFPFDLASGGGFPRGKVSVIYGPESAGKTNLALRAIAMHQMLWPDLVCALVDVEDSFDPVWAAQLGVDVNKLLVVKPDYAEQAVDIVDGFLHTSDCGLIVLDSIAMLVGIAEAEGSAERANVGGAGLIVGKLCRKLLLNMNKASKEQRAPTVILLNQIRMKVGVMYGNPEDMPGGMALKHASSMTVRCYGKNEMDAKVSKAMPVIKQTSFIIRKWKVPILSQEGVYRMVTIAHGGLKVGQCDDFNTVSEYLKAYGQFEKDPKKGWKIVGEHYDTIAPFKAKLYEDADFGANVRASIISTMMKGGNMIEAQASDDE